MRKRQWLELLLFKLVVFLWNFIRPRQALRVGAEKRKLRADAKALTRSIGSIAGNEGALERANIGIHSTKKDLRASAISLYLIRKRFKRDPTEEEKNLRLERAEQLRGSMGHIIHIQNRIQKSIEGIDPPKAERSAERTLDLVLQQSASAADLVFEFQPVPCSRFEALICRPGEDNFFGRVKADIEQAESNINIAMYGTRDEAGNENSTAARMVKLLGQKAAEGIAVNFIYDAFGTGTVGPRGDENSRALIERMIQKGICCIPNDPWDIQDDASLLRLDHRKLYVIDGKIAYVGGMGIEDHFENDGPDKNCHDVMARLEGEVVRQFQCAFLSSLAYQFAKPRIKDAFPMQGDREDIRAAYFPAVGNEGARLRARCLMNTPVADLKQISDCYYDMVGEAEEHVYVMNPHCTEDRVTDGMKATARRMKGVGENGTVGSVEKGVLGLHPNGKGGGLATGTTRHEFPGLLKAGTHIWLYDEGWLHGKVAVQDSRKVIIGSCNLDYFSMARNWEIAVYVEDEEVAKNVIEDIFVRDAPPKSLELEDKFSLLTRIYYALMDLIDRYF